MFSETPASFWKAHLQDLPGTAINIQNEISVDEDKGDDKDKDAADDDGSDDDAW